MREVVLSTPGDFAEWRGVARALLAGGVVPEDVSWRGAEEGASLFGDQAPVSSGAAVSLPRELLTMADRVICHRDAEVPARLYRVVWRTAHERQLLARTTDADVDWLRKTDKAIRRDIHKMHAFVRFRRLGEGEGRERFAAWFEPDHRILRLTAPFFRRRFYGMDWAIVTPDARAIWEDEELNYGPGGTRDEVPDSDVVEDQWRTYYGAIFTMAPPSALRAATSPSLRDRENQPPNLSLFFLCSFCYRASHERQDDSPEARGAGGRRQI